MALTCEIHVKYTCQVPDNSLVVFGIPKNPYFDSSYIYIASFLRFYSIMLTDHFFWDTLYKDTEFIWDLVEGWIKSNQPFDSEKFNKCISRKTIHQSCNKQKDSNSNKVKKQFLFSNFQNIRSIYICPSGLSLITLRKYSQEYSHSFHYYPWPESSSWMIKTPDFVEYQDHFLSLFVSVPQPRGAENIMCSIR